MSRIKPFFNRSWLRPRFDGFWSSVGVLLLAAALGYVPGLAGPGYASALCLAVLCTPVTAVAAALASVESGPPECALWRGLRLGLVHAILALLVTLLHAARVGVCDPLADLLLFALGPAAGLLTAGAYGSVVSLLAGSFVVPWRRLAWLPRVVLGWAGPALGVALSLWRFWREPVVFSFDPFFGFFAGTPYDTGFDPTLRLATYRLGTAGLLLLLFALLRHLRRSEQGRLSFGGRLDRPVLVLGSLGALLAAGISWWGPELGHRSSEAQIRAALGHSLRAGRCEVVYGAPTSPAAARRLGRDCDAWLALLERRLGVPSQPKVTAFVFAGSQQKEALMGAGRTQIAKPWRREVYLNGADYPHPVLGHELAHVVAGSVGRGPFRIAGAIGGLVPDPGRIEGLAVALAPDEDDDLTPEQWSKALLELGRLPRLNQLFALGFLAESGPLAYSVAGAFVDWVGKHHGRAALRRWYGGESLGQITGQDLSQLESRFRGDLTQVALSPSARERAKERFARPGVFLRRCPHAVDRALADAERSLGESDPGRACQLFHRAKNLDPTELRAAFGLGDCARAAGDNTASEQAYRRIVEDRTLADSVRARAREQMADLWLEKGDPARARAEYLALVERTFDTDRRRQLLVKAAPTNAEGARAISSLLLARPGEQNWELAVRDLTRWSEHEPELGLADYLLGRNYWLHERVAAAKEHLDRALSRRLEPDDIAAEAARLRTILACAEPDRPAAEQWLKRTLTHPLIPPARRQGLMSLVERCAGIPAPEFWSEKRLVAPHQPVPSPSAAPTSNPGEPSWAPSSFACAPSMVPIPGGEFWVGSAQGRFSPDESPRFLTNVASFCLDRTEVTTSAYQACVEKGLCKPSQGASVTCNARHPDRGNHPINCVSFHQATAYCQSQGARLPTEIEWEYAARGAGRYLKYPWGGEPPDGRTCWKQPYSCEVGSFPAGAFGLFDMSGNVWEWTSSDYGTYPWAADTNGQKVYRGGSWSRRFEKWMHLGLRNRWEPRHQGSHLGFRCAKTPKGVTCPFEPDPDGNCRRGVLAVDCPPRLTWNGSRCAPAGAPACPEGQHPEPGRGCVSASGTVAVAVPVDTTPVTRARSPEFDADCHLNQPARPQAYRYTGGSHEARNHSVKGGGCKNRDVGVGWNSACCP